MSEPALECLPGSQGSWWGGKGGTHMHSRGPMGLGSGPKSDQSNPDQVASQQSQWDTPKLKPTGADTPLIEGTAEGYPVGACRTGVEVSISPQL